MENLTYNKSMSNHCINCGLCCKLIPVDTGKQCLLRDGSQPLDEDFLKMINFINLETALNINKEYVESIRRVYPQATFYSCKFLTEDNFCSNPNKHKYCISYPSFPLVILHENCGYVGEIFIKSEEIKQKVRKYKEEIIYYEAMIASDCKDKNVYIKILDSLSRFIDKYRKFGADDW